MHAAEALASQIEAVQYTVSANMTGITAEQAAAEPPGGGTSLLWKLRHMLTHRNMMLAMLGQEAPAGDVADTYPDVTQAIQGSSAALADALRSAPERLAGPGPGGEGRLGDSIAGLVFHDAYHAGQLGAGRRSLGLPGAV